MATRMKPHQSFKVELGCGNETTTHSCPQDLIRRACPTLRDVIEHLFRCGCGQSVPIRIYVSIEVFDAAMSFLLNAPVGCLDLDEFRAIELLDFAWKYQSPELQQAAESLCLQADFANLHARSLINYHSSLLTHQLLTGKEDRENELLEAISRQGSEVLNYLSASKKMCFDTVKKILEQQRLNVFNEKEVFDCINEWRNNIINAAEEKESDSNEIAKFEQRWKEELLPLIRFEFFSSNDVNGFLEEQISPLSFKEKMTLLQKNPLRNIGLDRDLDLEYWSPWRGNYIPFTQRTMLLNEQDYSMKTWERLNIRPLERHLYLLSVRMFNLQLILDNIPETKLLLSVAVIREEDNETVSKTSREWKNGQSKYFMLSNPCLLKKDQKYRINVTYLERPLTIPNFYQPACDGQEYGNILQVRGTGNICGFDFAFAK